MDIEKLKKLVRDKPVQAAAGALAVLLVAGVVLFAIAPLIQKLMHGVK